MMTASQHVTTEKNNTTPEEVPGKQLHQQQGLLGPKKSVSSKKKQNNNLETGLKCFLTSLPPRELQNTVSTVLKFLDGPLEGSIDST